MILFPGSKSYGVIVIVVFLMLQAGIINKKTELRYEIKKNQKEYSLILEEVERRNRLALEGVR